MDIHLGETQARILQVIEEYIQLNGRPPTNREIGQRVGIQSTGHVDYHLTMLEKKGYILRERNTSRGIRLAREPQQGLPIVGRIAAGSPLEHFSEPEPELLDLGEQHQRGFVLQVQGWSMVEDHIADGDFVLVEPADVYRDGDIVVATHRTAEGAGGAATLKRLYREKERVRLQPANAQMQPIYVNAHEWDDEWEIQGKVKAVYRRY